jgi:nucleotidyltransferase AbiEii toxin of type IV toxin-antitoxin system
LSNWHALLDRAIRGLQTLRESNVAPNAWVLGGGTALMLQHQHRMSKDIDIFIEDAQYLPYLSPRLGGEAIWETNLYDEAAHYLKLRYPEGEIDFIVSAQITETVVRPFKVPGDAVSGIPEYDFLIEHPVEIGIKKLWHRGSELKVRDAFDLAVIAQHHARLLLSNLHYVKSKKSAILERLDRIKPGFFLAEIEELDILPEYAQLAQDSLSITRNIAKHI